MMLNFQKALLEKIEKNKELENKTEQIKKALEKVDQV